MIQKDHKIKDSPALIMGIIFKENCPDIRNTRVVDIYHELEQFGLTVDIYEADPQVIKREYGLDVLNAVHEHVVYDAIVVAVAHDAFLEFDYQKVKRNNGVIFDTKACLERGLVDGRL